MKVLITRKIPQTALNILKDNGIEVDLRDGPPLSEPEYIKAIENVDGLIAVIPDKVNKNIIESAKNLKVIAAYSVGFDHIDIGFATQMKIYVSNTPGDLTKSVAEHAFTLMLGLARRICEADKFVRDGKFLYWDPMNFIGTELYGKTLGIIGFGRIGRHLAKISHLGFNMEILYTDVSLETIEIERVKATKVSKEELLEKSDVVALCCNLCEETRHMIDTKEFSLMKPTAYLINTSRGGVICEKALVTALKDNIIAGAGLDVFEDEQPFDDAELYSFKNVILTPHIASSTYESRIQMAHLAADNIVDVLVRNTPPKNWVNCWETSSLV